MKKALLLLFLIICSLSYAQDIESLGYEYDKYSETFWKPDSICVLTPNSPLNASALEISTLMINGNHVYLTFKNKSDAAIYVKYDGMIVRWDDKIEVLRDRYKEELPPQKIAINDFAYLDNMYTYFGKKFHDVKELRKRYSKEKKDIPVEYRISFPIIYNDQRIDFCIIRSGIYRGKQKK